MSWVTNLILCFGASEDETARLSDVDKYFAMTSRPYGFGRTLTQHYRKSGGAHFGGSKVLEVNVAVGAFNGLDLPAFCHWISTLTWEDPSLVQLFVCDQEDEKFALMGWDEIVQTGNNRLERGTCDNV